MRRLRLLGPACVESIPRTQANTAAVAVPRFRSRRTVALLGYLVAERRSVARDFLAAVFWPDEATSKGRGNLRRELHNLAQILPGCWELDRQAVAFVPSAGVAVDLYTLLQLEAERRWLEAAEVLDGEFLEGLYLDGNLEFENWLLGERERWRGRAEAVLTRVIGGHTRRGHYADALGQARRLLQLAPWNESAHRQAMRLLAWTGQRGAALRQYETCKRTLWEELGVEPAGETTALCQQIQAGVLDLPPQLPAFLTEEGARHEVDRPLFVARKRQLAQLDVFLNGALAGQGQVVLITGGPGSGKTALMDAFARRAMEAHPDLLVASGNCSAHSGAGDPYMPWHEVMAMLTGDVEARWRAGAITGEHARRLWHSVPTVTQTLLKHGPHVIGVFVRSQALLSRATAATGTYDAPWLRPLGERIERHQVGSKGLEQTALFQQVTDVLQTLAETRPLLLILDDLQWADTASIGLLFHLGRRLEGVRILIAGAYRAEEVALGRGRERHPLEKVLSEFKRTYGDAWLDLAEVEEPEGRRFVDAFLDTEPNRLGKGFREALFDHTRGHPLFTIELLQAMQVRGDLVQDDTGHWMTGKELDWETLPARVEGVIEERVSRLEPELREIMSVASVEGEDFTAQVVVQVQGIGKRQVLRALSQELERRHRLVREQDAVPAGQQRLSRFRFAHALFQRYLYHNLGEGERTLLHGQVAGALEKLYAGHTELVAVQLAHHYSEAGDDQRALKHYALAGDVALASYASREAEEHFRRGLALAPGAPQRAHLLSGLGQALWRQSRFREALQTWREGIELYTALEDSEGVAWLYAGLAWAAWDAGDSPEALRVCREGLAALSGAPESVGLAHLLWHAGGNYVHSGQRDRGLPLSRQALEMGERLGDVAVQALVLASLGWYGWARALLAWADVYAVRGEPGDQGRAVELLSQSQAMFEEMGLPRFVALTEERLHKLQWQTSGKT